MFPPIGAPRILETTENTLAGYIVASPVAMAGLIRCFAEIPTYRLGRMTLREYNHPVFSDVVIDCIRQCPLRGPETPLNDITFTIAANFPHGGNLTASDITFFVNGEETTEIAPVHSNFLLFSMPPGSSVKITGNVFHNSCMEHSIFAMGNFKFRPMMKVESIPEVDMSNPFKPQLSKESLRYDDSNESYTISALLSSEVEVFDIFHERRGNEEEHYRYFLHTDGSYTAYEAHDMMLKLYESHQANGDKRDFTLFKRE